MMNPTVSSTLLTLADFHFEVPEAQIAQQPMGKREDSRLFYRRRDGTFHHSFVHKLPSLIPENALLIVNNTQVFASRLLGNLASGGKVELFLLGSPKGESYALAPALGRPMKKLKEGTVIAFSDEIEATIVSKQSQDAPLQVRFNKDARTLLAWLNQWGYVPLPPYIQRRSPLPAGQSADRVRYQTVYAEHIGSVAAPTAGLHFTPTLLAALAQQGVEVLPVTLHVGAGTFMPVKSEDIAAHPMHEEEFYISRKTMQALLQAKKAGRKVIVVGTTSLRCLEAAYGQAEGCEEQLLNLTDRWLRTRLFIHPQTKNELYSPWSADALMTNFHQPCSTLFMLVCALLGYAAAFAMYEKAIAEGYRFFSYGDASLIELR